MKSLDTFKLILISIGCAFVVLLNIFVMPTRFSPEVAEEVCALAPLSLVVRAPGRLEPKSSVVLKAQFDGNVVTKSFREGQVVKAGELLAVINRDKIRIDHQNKQNDFTNAKTALVRAQKEVRLQKILYSKEAVAYSSVEEAKTNLTHAIQALRAAEEAWKLEQERWNSAQVTAPIAGTVIRDAIGDDKTVAANKEMLIIADISGYSVQARVDELDIKRVSDDQPAEVRLQIHPDRVFKAHVSQIGSQTDTTESTSIPVTLLLDDSQGLVLRPKLSADIRIVVGETAPLLSVPVTAIVNTDGTPKVWAIDALGRLRARVVMLGQSNPERVEVTKGLSPDDRICTTAEKTLAEGMRVRRGQNKSETEASSFAQTMTEITSKLKPGRPE